MGEVKPINMQVDVMPEISSCCNTAIGTWVTNGQVQKQAME